MTDLTIFVVIGCDGVERFRIQDFSWGKTNNLSSCSHTESILEELANRSLGFHSRILNTSRSQKSIDSQVWKCE